MNIEVVDNIWMQQNIEVKELLHSKVINSGDV